MGDRKQFGDAHAHFDITLLFRPQEKERVKTLNGKEQFVYVNGIHKIYGSGGRTRSVRGKRQDLLRQDAENTSVATNKHNKRETP